MGNKSTTDSRLHLWEEQMDESSTSTLSLFKNSLFKDATSTFKEHLEKERVQQNCLDKCLMLGLQVVQRHDLEMLQVAPTLQILLQFGAQWKHRALLEHQMMPYHLICNSIGDHYELLDAMIKISGRSLIDKKDGKAITALLYAVQNANDNCVRSLIANGADVNITTSNFKVFGVYEFYRGPTLSAKCSPLVVTLDVLLHKQTQSSIIMTEILDLLLESRADVNIPNSKSAASPINIAIRHQHVECIVKLIKNGAQLNNIAFREYVWAKAACLGSVELLKCMFENGIDKDCTDQRLGKSLLSWVSKSRSVEAVSYLLDLGVTVPNFTPKSKQCAQCETNRLYFEVNDSRDPCMQAIGYKDLKIVKLLEEHGSQSCKYLEALQNAVRYLNLDTVEYLLSKYTYPLNDEYMSYNKCGTCLVLLTEPCYLPNTYGTDKVKITKLLLDHGADPNKKICNGKGSSALIHATSQSHAAIIALFIRNGVDINFRSYMYDRMDGYVLPFEASILLNRFYVAEMLLVSGCSCGVYSLDNSDMANIKSDLKDLMEKWHVQENNVIPLKQQCRRMLLNHLSPQADKKILELPLPAGVMRYLSIPELDDILDACKTSTRDIDYKQL